MLSLWSLLQTFPSMLSDQECALLIEEFAGREHKGESSYESSMHAVTGKITTSTFRSISLVPGTPAFELVHRRTEEVVHRWLRHLEEMQRFNIKAFRQCLRYAHDYRVLKYEAGGQIHPHTDWDPFTFASCTLALNDDYTGGNFAFFNGEHTLRLRKGDGMIWPADCFWVHEVCPVLSGVRYSVNSFITSIPEEMKMKTVQSLNALPKGSWQSAYQYKAAPG
jgi:hypothetical protein